jgi:hypothetical protein
MRRDTFGLLLSCACLALSCAAEEDPMDTSGSDAGAGQEAAVATPDAQQPSGGNDAAAAKDSAVGVDSSGGNAPEAGSTPEAGMTRDAGSDAAADASTSDTGGSTLPKFSFFVTSLSAMRTLSKSKDGFGGNLTFGETGEGAGLRGADKICAAAAELGMAGAGAKQWRAFLSTSTVNARTRIGAGPWYDRMGRVIAQDLTALLKERPEGAAMAVRDDLPNETGAPNRAGSAEGTADDNHDTITGTNTAGDWDNGGTCSDWTSITSTGTMGGPRVGHSWPANSGRNWMQAHRAPGCAPSVALVQMGGGSGTGIGNGGGYGGFYCFALTP